MNVLSLLLLLFFIFAILGVNLFNNVKTGNVIDEYTNFYDFDNAMIALLRIATGEEWNMIMYDCARVNGSAIPSLYFTSFVIMTSFVMLNMFIMVIL